MDSFRVAFFSALVLALPLATASANSQHQDSMPEDGVLSRYNQWSGFVRQYETPDGSILSEYSAQTTSDSVNGAILSVSLIPRFLCRTAQIYAKCWRASASESSTGHGCGQQGEFPIKKLGASIKQSIRIRRYDERIAYLGFLIIRFKKNNSRYGASL